MIFIDEWFERSLLTKLQTVMIFADDKHPDFSRYFVPRNFVATILYWLLLTASQLRSELLINIQLFNLPHPRLRTFRNNCRPDINCQSPVWRSLVKTWCIERVRGPGAEFPNKSSRLCDYLLALSIILKYCAVADHSICTGSPAPALPASTQLSQRNKKFQKRGVLVLRSVGNGHTNDLRNIFGKMF